ncbi:MAG: helix-turn-helix transcriptional regulator [Clostridiales bacterium]|nr:helix-turn-helix transcriptional regulator [Clostridiales bacterium]
MIRHTIDLFRKEQYMENPDFEIYYYSDAEPPNVFPHRHNFFEIYYLLSDQLDYVVGSQEYHMKRGDFLLLPPGLLHYPSEMLAASGRHYSRIVLWCDINFFEKFAAFDPEINHMWDVVVQNNSYHIQPSIGASTNLCDHLLLLLDEQAKPEFAAKAMLSSILMEIFVLINRITFEKKTLGKHTPSENLFSNLINYIHSHLSENLSLDVLSKQFFVSKGYLSRIFRDYMGISIHQYILSLRLEGCRNAIQNGLPIVEVVEMYGFQDYSSFYRAFKNAFSVSPREYRNTFSR